jgi:hypothetical protein
MPAEEPQRGDLTGPSAVLPVAEVVDIVREWVDLQAGHLPRFAGAYLWGGITALPADAPFPLYRDVDVVVVTEDAHDENQEIPYRGLMLEVIALDLAAHQDAEAVLASPSHGPNMATTQILADPTGILLPLQGPSLRALAGTAGYGHAARHKRRQQSDPSPPCAGHPCPSRSWIPCASFSARSPASLRSRNSGARPRGVRWPCCASYSKRRADGQARDGPRLRAGGRL